MRRILHVVTALTIVALSLGATTAAWAAGPGTGNDVGQGNGHGQGLQTAPGQTGIAPSNQQSPAGNAQDQANGQANSNGNGNGNSNAAHGNATSNATQGNGNGNGNGNAGQGEGTAANAETGNSGTIKISSDPLLTSSQANEPHPGCTFYVIGFNFPTNTGTYWFSPQPANGAGPAGTLPPGVSAPISYSNGATSPYNVVVQATGQPNQSGFDLQIGPITNFGSGQYKVFVNSSGTPGGAKQKVFRLDCPPSGPTTVSEENAPTPTETVQAVKTADVPTIGPDEFKGHRFTYNILVTRNGTKPEATQRVLVNDTIPNCPGFLLPDEVTTDNVGFTSTIDGCTVRVAGDAKGGVGNMVHLIVHVVPNVTGSGIPSAVTNTVNVSVPNAPGSPNTTASVTLPVVPPTEVAGLQATPPPTETETETTPPPTTQETTPPTTQSATPPTNQATTPPTETETETAPVTANAPATQANAAPETQANTTPETQAAAPEVVTGTPAATEIQGIAQTPVQVAGIQAGQSVTVPQGVSLEQNGETVTVTGPAVVMVESQPVTLPTGETLVLGVQAEAAQVAAPNTGVAGLVATDYVYTVQPGDTLESIATDWYGDPSFASSLLDANGDLLRGSTDLQPGMVLQLP